MPRMLRMPLVPRLPRMPNELQGECHGCHGCHGGHGRLQISSGAWLIRLTNKNPHLHEVDPVEISQKVCSRLKDEITTQELDELSGEICISMSTKHPDFGVLASRIVIDNHQKNSLDYELEFLLSLVLYFLFFHILR